LVTDHFDALGETFPEVRVYQSGDRADLVCRRPDRSLDLCEIKTRPGKKRMRQAMLWRGYAHRVWVAYEPPRRGGVSEAWSHRFRTEGVGVLWVVGDHVVVRVEAETRVANCADTLDRILCPEHRAYGEAGNAESKFMSAFRITCDNLRAAVSARPGITMAEAVAGMDHHYTSDKVARSSLLAWIRARKIKGIECRDVEGSRAFGLYPILTRQDQS